MASVFKRKRDRLRKGAAWFIAYTDENGNAEASKVAPTRPLPRG